MKAQPTGCSRARFWVRYECSENGNAYPGTLRKGPPKRAWEVPQERNKPAQVFGAPFESA